MILSIVEQIQLLREEKERLLATMPEWYRKKSRVTKEWVDIISDRHSVDLAEVARKLEGNELIVVQIVVLNDNNYSLSIGRNSLSAIVQVDREFREETCYGALEDIDLLPKMESMERMAGNVPVFMFWQYPEETTDEMETAILWQPNCTLIGIPKPFSWAPEYKKPTPKRKPVVLEKQLEEELLQWLHSRGVQADNQIQTSKHRMDLWIPTKCFLELKKGKVSGDDICQAIDYCAEYKIPVVVVGNHISEMASRGIEAFNKAIEVDMLAFVQWSAVKTYLKGLLSC